MLLCCTCPCDTFPPSISNRTFARVFAEMPDKIAVKQTETYSEEICLCEGEKESDAVT